MVKGEAEDTHQLLLCDLDRGGWTGGQEGGLDARPGGLTEEVESVQGRGQLLQQPRAQVLIKRGGEAGDERSGLSSDRAPAEDGESEGRNGAGLQTDPPGHPENGIESPAERAQATATTLTW